jgi:5-methylcytosine-specific restriction endonuclease McrA
MRHVIFDPAALTGEQREWFDKWSPRAARATRSACKAVSEGRPVRLSGRVWSDLKAWLLEHVFAGKCAYCETKMLAQGYGAADHYRPKGRVAERDSAGRLAPCERRGSRHQGYYWLAYHWQNLIPICERCNSGSGKQDQFPIGGQRVYTHDELSDPADIAELDRREVPLLLHPYLDDPAEHLQFGALGVISERNASLKGRSTIEVCGLDRGALSEERHSVQEQVRIAVADAHYRAAYGLSSLDDALNAVRDRFANCDAEYSATALQEFTDRIAEEVRVLQSFVE